MKKFVNRVIELLKPPTGGNRGRALSPEMLRTVEGTRVATEGNTVNRQGFSTF